MKIDDLRQIKRYRSDIESLQERVERLRSQAERYTKPLSLAPGGDHVDYLPEYAAKLDELQRKLQEKELELQSLLGDVDAWADTLPEQQGKVVRFRYVNGLRWKEVAPRAGYSERHCKNIHTVAISKVRTQKDI